MGRLRIRIVCFFTCFIYSTLAIYAQKVVVLDNSRQTTKLGLYVKYLRDDTKKLTLQDILKDTLQRQFIPTNTKATFNLGPGEASVWIKMKLKAVQPGKYLLEFGETGVEELVLYGEGKVSGRFNKIAVQGDNIPYAKRKFKTTKYLFELDFQDRAIHTFYLKCYIDEVLIFPLRVGSYQAFLESNHLEDLVMGGFYGIMLIMIFYNFFIFISTKERVYLYYILYVVSAVLTSGSLKGHTLQFLWPNNVFFNDLIPFYVITCGYFITLFANRFLNTRQNAPTFFKISSFFYGAYTLAMLSNFFDRTIAIGLSMILVIMSSLFVITMGVVIMRKNYRPARLYLVGWASLMTVILLVVISNAGLLPFDAASTYLIEAGMTSEVLLFSIALADRINFYRRENERIIQEQNEYLEREVAQRTKEIEQQKEEILAQSQTLEDSNQSLRQAHGKIRSSIQYAKRIQLALLPMQKLLAKNNLGFFILYKPRDIVSGDFYWFAEIEKDSHKQLIIAVGDCTGHGVPGAFMTIMGTNLLNQIVKENEVLSPAAILNELDKKVTTALGVKNDRGHKHKHRGKGNHKVQDGMDLAICKIDFDQKQLTFAGAKRPLYFYDNNQLEVIRGSKFPIGSSQYAEKVFEERTRSFQKGNAMYAFSDGYADQFGGEKNMKFMVRKFKNLLKEIEPLPMPEQKGILEQTMEEWKGYEKQTDDILVVGVRF